MYPAQIVMSVVKGNRGNVIFEFLRERVGEPGEPAHPHSHGEILTLNVAGGDVLRIGRTYLGLFLTAIADGGAVPLLAVRIVAVNLDEHGIVDVFAEPIGDGLEIRLVAIGGELHAVSEAASEILYEGRGASHVTLTHQPRANKLRVRIHSYPSPYATNAELIALFARQVFILGSDERPYLVALNALARQVHQSLIRVLSASRAEFYQQLGNRVFGNTGHAYRRTNRIAFHQRANHLYLLFDRQLVHTSNYATA
jgi:hypothetical protein